MKNLKQNKGITLIALVITIIVLLILAGVTINMLTGESGILKNAEDAARRTELAQIKETVELLNIENALDSTSSNSGTLEQVLETSEYNNYEDKLYILGGTLVYDPTKCSEEEIANAKAVGIKSMEEYTIIRTTDDLKAFRDEVNNGNTYEGKEVYLLNNIILSSTEEWTPIGVAALTENGYRNADSENNKPFKGIFDGCGYEIDGMYINTTAGAQGLFALIEGATIRNLSIGENCSITGGINTAGFVAYMYNGSIVDNCYNKADIVGQENSGGIAGSATLNCVIEDSYNEGIISISKTGAGGIVGLNNEGSLISECYNNGQVIASSSFVGGITGLNSSSSINKCYNNAKVTGLSLVGGIAGNSGGSIHESYNIGDVEATGWEYSSTPPSSYVGGLVGVHGGILSNCYNTGTIKGAYSYIGGLIGINRGGEVSNSYNIGKVDNNTSIIGTIVGGNYNTSSKEGKIQNCYSLEDETYDINAEGDSELGSECSEKTSDELKVLAPTLGNAFTTDTTTINQGYPILKWQLEQ